METTPPFPLKVNWIYGYPDDPPLTSRKLPTLRNIATHRILGDRFTGKSALGEAISFDYLAEGSTLYDFYAANDNESLAALNGPYKDRAVLVHGDQVKLGGNFETLKISELDPRRTADGKLFITCKAFYPGEEEHYGALFSFTRKVQTRNSWDRVDVLFIREAQEYISSKLRTGQSRTRKEAAEDFLDFHNQCYHSGMAVVLDSQREMEVAKGARELSTFTYFKNLGAQEIPRRIWWIASDRFANFDLDALRRLKPNQFVIMTNRNSVGLGVFDMPRWHINRGEGLLGKLGITVTDLEGVPVKQREEAFTPLRDRGHPVTVMLPQYLQMLREMEGRGCQLTEVYEELKRNGYQGSKRTVKEYMVEAKLAEKLKNTGDNF
jgi:hypothetical protein